MYFVKFVQKMCNNDDTSKCVMFVDISITTRGNLERPKRKNMRQNTYLCVY